jgi:hypothetical protein
MESQIHEIHDVLKFAEGLIYFVCIGAATVLIALAAHLP